ncbi:four-helix bundle copper-binding protein [Halobacillus seohaensis]|uniref:Four-helix bundle copper-binding protein n=1 Tax=Halobacillus seohaensis TaxID=447421 RepID=A0ABW2EPD2_9BACI
MGILSMSPTNMDRCIEECLKCARACEECHTACLQEPDVQARIACIQHLNDCAEICFQAAAFMSRNSQNSQAFCALCAASCEACATECEKFKDEHCQECAKICRQCAEECRKMAS